MLSTTFIVVFGSKYIGQLQLLLIFSTKNRIPSTNCKNQVKVRTLKKSNRWSLPMGLLLN